MARRHRLTEGREQVAGCACSGLMTSVHLHSGTLSRSGDGIMAVRNENSWT
jgi:hypothetical protein